MLKEQLLKEAQEIEVSVELDGIFEALSLTDEEQATFKQVFESAVVKHSTALAESHIETIAESAETKVDELVKEGVEKVEQKLKEENDKFFKSLAEKWLQENAVAIDRNIKVGLFESMFEGLKELVINHNVILPEESVDVVAEMEQELQEANDEASKLFEENVSIKAQIDQLKREKVVTSVTESLTESQREKVTSLLEGMTYGEDFESKVKAIVSMVESKKEEKPLTESTINKDTEFEQDFQVVEHKQDPIVEATTKQPSPMDIYLKALA